MRTRGTAFWDWADPTLHCRTHDEELSNGASIDVQVRLSRMGVTQLFIGVYASSGEALYEEGIDCRSSESMTRALAWGVGKARQIAEQGVSQPPMRSKGAG
ncbi:MAG: hypothetical protein RR736_23935 [Pseudomonas sp.]|uniref:hypothetical protein n=1 Tax=Pseudomonas sp. TaxID=306 RepID=UPI002FCBFD56